MIRDGLVMTPPATEGRLESISLEILIGLCRSMAIPVMERPVDRTELYVANELALMGTLAEIVPVKSVDEHELPAQTPILNKIADRFWSAVRGIEPSPTVSLTLF